MGKRIRGQRRGKGTLIWRSHSHRHKGIIRYLEEDQEGTIGEFIHDPGRSAPVAVVSHADGHKSHMIASEGMKVGDKVGTYEEIGLKVGMVKRLKDIPEGIPIYNVERYPQDGGKLVRSSGGSAQIVLKEASKIKISLRSRKFVEVSPLCRATIGIVGGGGRREKPFGKAGKLHIAKKARGKLHPRTRGSAMNPVNHPFGGTGNPGKPKSTKRNSPPGQKVGSISSKRTGRTKRK